MSNSVTFNPASRRYEMPAGEHVVYADIRREGDVVYIDYVFAPPALRGTGAAGKFMEGLMSVFRTENLKTVPLCGYAATWVQRHPEYKELLKA
jgi:uncharacterized protein